MALGDVVNLGTRDGSGGKTTYTTALGATATSGNLLVCWVCVTVSGRTCTTPSGWNVGRSNSAGTAFSFHSFWKESDGTETGSSLVLSGSGGGYANIIEFDATGADLSSTDAVAEDVTNISTPSLSQSTGTAVGTGSNGVAVALFGVDIGGNVSDGRAYTNSFVEQDTSDMGNTSRGGYLVASKVITGTSNETTFSTTETAEEMYGGMLVFSASAVFTIDSTPGTVNSQTQESSQVSNPAVAPTPGNTEVKFDDDSGPAATVNSTPGSDPYTLNYTFPRTAAKKFDATGYPLYHEVAAENATSAAVPYLPIASQTYVDLSSPVDTAGTLGETYAGSATATSDQWVYDTNLTGDATITLTVDAQGYWILSGTPSVTSTASFYRIDSTGTVDVEDTIEFEVGSPPAGDGNMLTEIVSPITSNIVSNM